MIEEINVKGFKSLKDVSLQIRPLTLLIGLNSSGKSSLIQLITILKQSVVQYKRGKRSYDKRNNLMINGDLINLGTFSDIIFQKKKRRVHQVQRVH